MAAIRKKPTAATTTRRAPAPTAAKKRTAPAPAPAPAKKRVATASKPVRATRTAAPAPAAKKATPAPVKRTVTPKPAAAPKVSSYDVLAAGKAADIALARYEELKAAFWSSQDSTIQDAAEHAAEVAKNAELSVPKKQGRAATKEGVRKPIAPEPNVIGEFYDIDKVKAMGVVELRELANELADNNIITERKLKGKIYEQMEAAGLFRKGGSADADADAEDVDEDGEEGEEDFDEYEDDETEAADSADDDSDDEEDDGGDDGEDDDEFSEEDLKSYSLKRLQGICEKWGIPWKDLTQPELVEAIIDAGSEDEDEESEDEEADEEEFEEDEDSEDEDDEEDEEDDGDEEEDEEEEEDEDDDMAFTMEEIDSMNADQLTGILNRVGVRIPSKSKNNVKSLRELLLSVLEEQDEE